MNLKDIYLDKHIKCGLVIENYDSNIALSQNDYQSAIDFEKSWLEKHKILFSRCIVKPDNLPWIHLSFSNEYYYIKDFANLYQKVLTKISI